jgi:hypothetical protein
MHANPNRTRSRLDTFKEGGNPIEPIKDSIPGVAGALA